MPPRGGWRPSRGRWGLIRADTAEEVPAALAAIEAARASGRYVAGYFSYELGYVLETRLAPLLPSVRAVPLLWFGVFDAPATIVGACRRCRLRIRGSPGAPMPALWRTNGIGLLMAPASTGCASSSRRAICIKPISVSVRASLLSAMRWPIFAFCAPIPPRVTALISTTAKGRFSASRRNCFSILRPTAR